MGIFQKSKEKALFNKFTECLFNMNNAQKQAMYNYIIALKELEIAMCNKKEATQTTDQGKQE